MKYLDALNEMTDAQRALKNRIMGRTSRGQMLTPGEHSTGGSKRGVKKVKGEKPKPSKHRKGRLLRTTKGPNPMKGHIAADDLVKDFTAAPEGKIPGPKPGEKPGEKLQVSHTEYLRIGALMAEALGLTEGIGTPADMFKDMGIKVKAVDTSKAGRRKRPMSLPQQQRLQPKKFDRPEHEAEEKRKSAAAARSARASREDSHTVYKQIGIAIAEAADRGFYKSKAARASETAQATDEREPGQPLKPARSKDAGKSKSLSPTEKGLVKKGVKTIASKLGVPSKSINPRTAAAVQVGARATRKQNTERRIGGVGNASKPRPGQNPVGS